MSTKSAIFLDFDNVFSTLWDLDRDAAVKFASEPADWLEMLASTYLNASARRWLVARCYLNPAGYVLDPAHQNERYYYSKFRPGFVRAGFEVIDCPVLTRGGKNAADIRIVIDALDLLNHRTRFDEFVLASGDSDFTPLLQRLRAEDRLITIASPGYLSSAYTSLADQLLGFDALEALLQGQPDPPDELASKAVTATDPHPAKDASDSFAHFIHQRYASATAPLNLAALASEVTRICPLAKESNWLGKGTFRAAVTSLRLPNVRFSNHHLWDEERHQPPETKVTKTGLPGPIMMLTRAVELPRIASEDWPKVFRILASYAAAHQFNLTEAGNWARDALVKEGVPASRTALNYVIRGAYFGGVQLDARTSPSADDVGKAFLGALLDRAGAVGVPLDPEMESTLCRWLGLSAPASQP